MASEAEAAVNALKKLEANKTCVNCGNYNRFGHQNICEKVRTFVCSTCKSAHQSYSMRVKSVSMSNWTMEEVDALREVNGGGNAVASRVWYGHWDETQMRKPTQEDTLDYFKQCINRVYNDKAFYKGDGLSEDASCTSSSDKGSSQPNTSVLVADLLDFDAPTQKQASSGNRGAFGSSFNEEWGNFVSVPSSATSNDEFGAFASAPALTSTSENNEFADFSAAPVAASTDLFGAFASTSPAPTSNSFDPFAGSGGSVLTPNAPSFNSAAPFDPFARAFTNQGKQPTANVMNQYNARPAPKDYSVFDGLSSSSPAYGTTHRNSNGQVRGMEMNGHNQQRSGGFQQQPQFCRVQPIMGSDNAGTNISTYFSPNAREVPGNGSARRNSRDPFAGLGL